jgi:hypothetical protein
MAVVGLCAGGLLLSAGKERAGAATMAQKGAAVEAALKYLAQSQHADGRWTYSGDASYDCAATAAALVSFQKAGFRVGESVVIDGTDYGDVIGNGLDYVFHMAQQVSIGARPHGDPDTNGNGLGARFGINGRDIFITGAVLPAIVLTDAPQRQVTTGVLAGRTYQDVVQDAVDYFAYAQVAVGNYYDGGWRYSAGYAQSDQSCSPWPVKGMLAAAQWGIDAPAWVTSELDKYLSLIQNPSDGGVYYMPYNQGGMGTNTYRTGEFLTQKHHNGDAPGETAMDAALNFLNSRWQTTASGFNGNFGNPGAMWAAFQGLAWTVGLDDTTHITNLRPFDPGSMQLDGGADWTWYEDYCEWLIDTQYANGSWAQYGVWYGTMPTSFYTEMLLASVPEPGSLALLALGAAGVVVRSRRRRA